MKQQNKVRATHRIGICSSLHGYSSDPSK